LYGPLPCSTDIFNETFSETVPRVGWSLGIFVPKDVFCK